LTFNLVEALGLGRPHEETELRIDDWPSTRVRHVLDGEARRQPSQTLTEG
jgi:hypothetical protein